MAKSVSRASAKRELQTDLFGDVNQGGIRTEKDAKPTSPKEQKPKKSDSDDQKLNAAIDKTIRAKQISAIEDIECDVFSATDHNYIIKGNILDFEVKKPLVDLIVTSPPYNLDIQYNSNDDKLEYREYLAFTRDWLAKCFEVSNSGARLCLNIPLDKNKGGMQSIYADFVQVAREVGWQYFTTIVWNEGNISRRTAWGSWLSASAPYVIAPVEMIVILFKDQWKKTYKGKSNIERDEFMNWTNGLWTFNGESKKRIGHPAPFPFELPDRCIKLFSYEGDVVMDPFLGSGTTLMASWKNRRVGIGIELDLGYCELARKRLEKFAKDSASESNGVNPELFQEQPPERN